MTSTSERRAGPGRHRRDRAGPGPADRRPGRRPGRVRRRRGADGQLGRRLRADLVAAGQRTARAARCRSSSAWSPIVIFFQVKNSLFLSAGNLVNLMIQACRSSSCSAWPRSSCCCSARSTCRSASPRPSARSSACGAAYTLPWRVAILVGPGRPAPSSGRAGRDHHPAGAALVRGHPGRPARPVRPAPLPDPRDRSIGAGGVDRQPEQHHQRHEGGQPGPRRQLDRDDRPGCPGRGSDVHPGPAPAEGGPGRAAARGHRCSRWP